MNVIEKMHKSEPAYMSAQKLQTSCVRANKILAGFGGISTYNDRYQLSYINEG